MPRSLKLPVGFPPSYFRKTSQPVSSDSGSERTSGVPPSRSVTTGVASLTGRRSRYSSITPRQAWAVMAAPSSASGPSLLSLHAEDAPDLADRRELLEPTDRLLERSLPRAVGDEDELGLLPGPLLPHASDRDAVVAENRCDLREDADRK